jgi:hypothetical protein
VTALNVFAHNRDPYGFLLRAKVDYAHRIPSVYPDESGGHGYPGEFDTVYHEHISFFNCSSMKVLVERAGMRLVDVVKTRVHGTSYLFTVMLDQTTEAVGRLMREEAAAGLQSLDTYFDWAKGICDFKTRVNEVLPGRFIAYGAAAKGNTLLNFTGIKPDVIIDDNPLKQGLIFTGREYLLCRVPTSRPFRMTW